MKTDVLNLAPGQNEVKLHFSPKWNTRSYHSSFLLLFIYLFISLFIISLERSDVVLLMPVSPSGCFFKVGWFQGRDAFVIHCCVDGSPSKCVIMSMKVREPNFSSSAHQFHHYVPVPSSLKRVHLNHWNDRKMSKEHLYACALCYRSTVWICMVCKMETL